MRTKEHTLEAKGQGAKKVYNLIIVDESGSMSIIHKEALAGINETITCRLQRMRSAQRRCSAGNVWHVCATTNVVQKTAVLLPEHTSVRMIRQSINLYTYIKPSDFCHRHI